MIKITKNTKDFNEIVNEIENDTINTSKEPKAVTTTTVNKLGEKIITQTISPYEQQKFEAKKDWRIKFINASNLYLRLENVYVNSEVNSGGFTFILHKNMLK